MESRMIIDEDGIQRWHNKNGQLHRTDGPAVIWGDAEEWYQNGLKHRTDGPAVILLDGEKRWYKNGQLHRENGPAVIWANGEKEWWIEGKIYSFQEWTDELNLDQKTRLELVMKWNPE